MPDRLLSEATIHLFGREISDLVLVPKEFGERGTIAGHLKPPDPGRRARELAPMLARIYAFAYQNEFVELASPALFIVKGPGANVDKSIDTRGVLHIPAEWSEGVKVWTHERDDLTIRLDVMAGSFDRVLLEYELAEPGLQGFAPRGGNTLGQPSPRGLRGRRARWRSDED